MSNFLATLTVTLAVTMFSTSLLSFVSNWNHILSTLISLEFIALSLFLSLSTISPTINFETPISLFYLTIAVCEGALGLSILILFARAKGNDILSVKDFLQW